jgi:hypothetical protein
VQVRNRLALLKDIFIQDVIRIPSSLSNKMGNKFAITFFDTFEIFKAVIFTCFWFVVAV